MIEFFPMSSEAVEINTLEPQIRTPVDTFYEQSAQKGSSVYILLPARLPITRTPSSSIIA